MSTTLGKLSRKDCIKRYTQRNAGLSSLLVVSANITGGHQESFDLGNPRSSLLFNKTQDEPGSDWAFQPYWMCSAWNVPADDNSCTKQFLEPKADNWTLAGYNWDRDWDGDSPSVGSKRIFWSKVDYCLPLRDQEPMDDRCTLRISTVILGFVSALNLLKVVCIFYTAHLHHEDWEKTLPQHHRKGLLRAFKARFNSKESLYHGHHGHTGPYLVTIGDAIVSFLEKEDIKTKGFIFATKATFNKPRPWEEASSGLSLGECRWFRAASITHWAITITPYVRRPHNNQYLSF